MPVDSRDVGATLVVALFAAGIFTNPVMAAGVQAGRPQGSPLQGASLLGVFQSMASVDAPSHFRFDEALKASHKAVAAAKTGCSTWSI